MSAKSKNIINASVIIPTYNAGDDWEEFLRLLLCQAADFKILVVDSSSNDGTVHLAKQYGIDVLSIPHPSFNHGGTRRIAVDCLGNVELVVFMTQDAFLANSTAIARLVDAFHDDPAIGAVYGRQLPRKQAGPIEVHARLFNYPSRPYVRSFDDRGKYGLKTAFISNSFAAYRMSVLSEVGGFPENVIFGEDMYVSSKMLLAGYKLGYVADACVYHSHGYSMVQEMKRYFDMGVFHSSEPWIRAELGGAEKEGVKFVVSEVKYLSRHAFWRIPEGMLRTLLRYIGFRLGLLGKHIPLIIKKKVSMNPGYFKIE